MHDRYTWGLAWVITIIWIVTVIADILSPEYTVPDIFYPLMTAIAGWAFGREYMQRRKAKEE